MFEMKDIDSKTRLHVGIDDIGGKRALRMEINGNYDHIGVLLSLAAGRYPKLKSIMAAALATADKSRELLEKAGVAIEGDGSTTEEAENDIKKLTTGNTGIVFLYLRNIQPDKVALKMKGETTKVSEIIATAMFNSPEFRNTILFAVGLWLDMMNHGTLEITRIPTEKTQSTSANDYVKFTKGDDPGNN